MIMNYIRTNCYTCSYLNNNLHELRLGSLMTMSIEIVHAFAVASIFPIASIIVYAVPPVCHCVPTRSIFVSVILAKD